MTDEPQIQNALPSRALRVSEVEKLIRSSDEYLVWPSSILTDEAGHKEVVTLLLNTGEHVHAVGFDPEKETWVGFEKWDVEGDEFNREKTNERIQEWVGEHHEDVVSHSSYDLEEE